MGITYRYLDPSDQSLLGLLLGLLYRRTADTYDLDYLYLFSALLVRVRLELPFVGSIDLL